MIFRVFSRLEVRDRAGAPVVITGRKQRMLLVALLVRVNEWTSNRWLVNALWGEDPPASAPANLKTFVWRLRRLLPSAADGDRIEARRGEYRIVADPEECDALAVKELRGLGRRAEADGDVIKAEELLGQAAALWRGDLPDDLVDTPLLAAERNRLVEDRWGLFEDWFALRLRCGDHAEVVRDAQKLLAEHPLRERLWYQLMLALYRSGRRAEALTAYQEVYALLDRELGIPPGRELQQLQRDILRDEAGLRWSEPGPAGARAGPVPSHLPADLASFTGRDHELSQLLSAAAAGPEAAQARATVCTIDGMAGVGKTALAVHAAHLLARHFPDGQLFLDLHGFTQGLRPMSAADALDRLLRALGVPHDEIPRHLEDRSALYRCRLAGRRVLVLLDNVADESQVVPLVPAAPGCLLLVTGRRRLTGIDDAVSLSLDVLPLADAVGLFSQIVGRQRTRWELDPAAELVELCGRLPLAIRIAAARLNARPTWTIAQLVDRLRDRQHRLTELEAGQRSVLAVLDVSHQHLTGELQRVFRLLGLHPGTDIHVDAAAALADLCPRQAERALEALVDVHLLTPAGDRRYRFHDLVRQHAAATAERSEPIDSRHGAIRRLFEHWIQVGHAAAALAGQVAPGTEPLETVDRPDNVPFTTAAEAIEWFAAERKNLLAGIGYAAQRGLHDYTWRLTEPLRPLFNRCGYVDDWLRAADAAVTAARQLGDPRRLAVALRNAGSVNMAVGRNAVALAQLQEALEALTSIQDRRGMAAHSVWLGYLAFRMGRCAEFLDRQWAALRLFVELGDLRGEAMSRGLIGLYLWRLGRYREALEQEREGLDRCVKVGDEDQVPDLLAFAALINDRLGHDDEALRDAERSLAGYELAGDKRGQTYALNIIAMVQLRRGQPVAATRLLLRALGLIRAVGERRTEGHTTHLLGIAHRMLGRADDAARDQERALTLARESGDPALRAEVLHEIGLCRGAAGDQRQALRLHRRALELAETVGDPYLQAVFHRDAAAALDALGDADAARHHRDEAATRFAALGLPAPHPPGGPA